MISKEEFIREVEKEISVLEATGLLQKIRKKKYNPIFLYAMYIFFGGAAVLVMLPIREQVKGVTFIFVFLGMIVLLLYKNKNTFYHEQGKPIEKNYEKMLSLIGVKKVTDGRFHKFGGIIGIRMPHASPAYQIGNFIFQNFIDPGVAKRLPLSTC